MNVSRITTPRTAAAGFVLAVLVAVGAVVAFVGQSSGTTAQTPQEVAAAVPDGTVNLPDPSALANPDSLVYAGESKDATFFTAAGQTPNTRCLVIAAKAGSATSGQIGCDVDAAVARGDVWMTEEIGASGQVGAMLVPPAADRVTVNGSSVSVTNGVIALSGDQGVKLVIEAYGADGERILRKSLPASVGDLSGNARVSTVG